MRASEEREGERGNAGGRRKNPTFEM